MPGSFSDWAAITTIVSAVAAILKNLLPRRGSTGPTSDARTKTSNLFAVSYIFVIILGIGLLFYLNSESELLNTISSLSREISDFETNISSLHETITGQKQDILQYQDSINTMAAQAHKLLKTYEDTSQMLKKVRVSLAMHKALAETLEKKFKRQKFEHTKQLQRYTGKIQELIRPTAYFLLPAMPKHDASSN